MPRNKVDNESGLNCNGCRLFGSPCSGGSTGRSTLEESIRQGNFSVSVEVARIKPRCGLFNDLIEMKRAEVDEEYHRL